MKILYLTYDGLTDPLGRSQVIPYLEKLSEKGHEIHIISTEKKIHFDNEKGVVNNILDKAGVIWHPIDYHAFPPVLSTVFDVQQFKNKISKLHKLHSFDIIHCRSYITAIAGLWFKRKKGVKFIFDMRGFFADERVDGEIWNLNNPVYKLVFSYFKKKEADFFSEADYTVCLTEAGKKEIHSWQHIRNQPIPIQVIPCCADMQLFNADNVTNEQREKAIQITGINNDDFVLSYLGSIGTWYLPYEMLQFFAELLKKVPKAKFLFITKDNPEEIIRIANKLLVPANKIIIKPAQREDIPALLSLTSLSVFFIKPVFSKKASSPTKQAEIMAMGIPVVCNSNVGDSGEIIKESFSGIVLDDFKEHDFRNAVNKIDEILAIESVIIRENAESYFSLERGVKLYDFIYNYLS